jgi:sec-independent protein translocase protein TatA
MIMPVGPGEIALIAAVALLIFGPKRLPELGKAIGQGLGNFKKSLKDAQQEMTTAMDVEETSTQALPDSEASKGENAEAKVSEDQPG